MADDEDGVFGGDATPQRCQWARSLARLADPVLQGFQLLGVLNAGLVVGDGGGGRVVHADKATVDSASCIGLVGHINGYLLNEGVALLSDDLDGRVGLTGLRLGLSVGYLFYSRMMTSGQLPS